FPFILDELGDLGSKKFALLIDEAHSSQGGKTTLVSAKRWKAATHGVEPLRELHTAMTTADASAGVYVAALGQVSDNAQAFAREHGIVVLQGDAVAQLLLQQR
ncbi:hypothetical protein KXX11_004006, partial [Aspergillus fumigatus]